MRVQRETNDLEWGCDACGNYLGDARPEYSYDMQDWRFCPYCGEALYA